MIKHEMLYRFLEENEITAKKDQPKTEQTIKGQ